MEPRSELLTQIPPILLPKKINSVRMIEGGFNNRNILINESWLIKEYNVRDETNDPVYLRFLREKDSLLLLNQNSHTPQLLKYYDDGINFFIARKWVDGQPLTNELLKDNVELLVDAITSFYNVTESTEGDFHYYDVIKQYLLEYKGFKRHYPTSPSMDKEFSNFPSYERVDRLFIDHIHQLQRINSVKPLVRTHGDLVLSNIILTLKNPKIVFIDWEYSTLSDPLIDLAYLLSQNKLSYKIQQIILTNYEEQLGIQVNSVELKLFCDLMNLMSGLWYANYAVQTKLVPSRSGKQEQTSADLMKLALDQFQALNLVRG